MQAVLVSAHNPLSLKGPPSNRVYCASGGKKEAPRGGEALCPGSHSEPAAPPRTLSPALALPPWHLPQQACSCSCTLWTELSSPAGFLLPPWRLPCLCCCGRRFLPPVTRHIPQGLGAVLSSQGSFPRLLIPARPSERPEEPQAGQAGACTRVLVAGLQASC